MSGQRSLVAGQRGPEGLHERRRPGSRDAEELLDVAAREPLAVQRRELADGVGDGEEPPGRGGIGERRVGYNPCGACEMGRCTARMLYSRLVDGRPRHKPRAGRGRGSHKGSYGTVSTGDEPSAVTRGPRRAQRAAGARRPRGPGRAPAVTPPPAYPRRRRSMTGPGRARAHPARP